MDQLLQGLNNAQRSAVTSEANVVQVLAPPGSGKTKTLTARVSYLITQCGLQPWNIIVCTFTVKAAREMKERIKELVGNGLEKKLILGTFHSVARRFLVSYGQHIGIEKNFGIADTSDSKAIIKRVIKDNQLTIEPNVALGRISSQKAKSISSDQYAATVKKAEEQDFCIVYCEYEAALKASNLLDYDDLLLRCAFLLRSHPQCVSNIQAVLIDEFQDTNEVQYELMTLFAQKQKAITIVGDPDQSIYGWRNAEIKNLKRMTVQYPDTLVIFLEENYRSSGAILHSAQTIIEQDETRPDKRLQATHGHGELPILRRLPSAEAEARWLVAEIRRTQALSGDLLKHGDFAVLLRSAPLSRHIEAALGNAGLPYRMVGGTKFYDRAEVKVILDYLRVVNQPEHNDALLRILNVPARGIGEVTVKGLLDEAQAKAMPLWKLILNSAQGMSKPRTKLSAQAERGLAEFANVVLTSRKKLNSDEGEQSSPVVLVDHLLKRLEFEKFLKKKYPEDFDARWANVEELKAQTADLSAAIARGDDLVEEENLPTINGLDQRAVSNNEDALSIFLANIALSSESQKKAEGDADQAQCITISTIHAAKGLEWPVVFIPACYDGSIPHSRAEDHDEERRLLYVGMTRAQTLLYLSCPVKNSQMQETTLSAFLTRKGVEAHFNVQGPPLEYYAVSEVARTLRRDCPTFASIQESRRKLDNLEDSYWSLDGTRPLEELSKWNHGREPGQAISGNAYAIKRQRITGGQTDTTRPVPGFVSAASVTTQNVEGFSTATSTLKPDFITAASRLEELDALQENAVLRKIDQRTQEAASKQGPGKKGAKVATGTASIASYFGNTTSRAAVVEENPRVGVSRSTSGAPARAALSTQASSRPLHDITNSKVHQDAAIDEQVELTTRPYPPQLLHKPRTAPSLTRPRNSNLDMPAERKHKDYIFLSSSPPRHNTDDDQDTPNVAAAVAYNGRGPGMSKLQPAQHSSFRPASTFHVTSVTSVAQVGAGGMDATQAARKTLGVGRSFKPWSARGGKR